MSVDSRCAGVAMLLLVMLFLSGAVSCGSNPEAGVSDHAPPPPAAADAVSPGAFTPPSPRPETPAELSGIEGLDPGSDLAATFLQAAELARTGLYDRALVLYERILVERPEHAPTLINTARIHFIRGRTSEAIELLQRADRAAPGRPRILAYLGMAEAKAGLLEDALIHLEESWRLDPTPRIDVGNELAGVYFQLERHEEAAEAWSRVLKLDPENMMARAGLGRLRQLSQPADIGRPQI